MSEFNFEIWLKEHPNEKFQVRWARKDFVIEDSQGLVGKGETLEDAVEDIEFEGEIGDERN